VRHNQTGQNNSKLDRQGKRVMIEAEERIRRSDRLKVEAREIREKRRYTARVIV